MNSALDVTIAPLHRMLIPTDLAVELPKGTYGRIASRSGLSALHSVDVAGGVIDPDYRGNVKVLLCNQSTEEFRGTHLHSLNLGYFNKQPM